MHKELGTDEKPGVKISPLALLLGAAISCSASATTYEEQEYYATWIVACEASCVPLDRTDPEVMRLLALFSSEDYGTQVHISNGTTAAEYEMKRDGTFGFVGEGDNNHYWFVRYRQHLSAANAGSGGGGVAVIGHLSGAVGNIEFSCFRDAEQIPCNTDST